MWQREKPQHGVFTPDELSELQRGFDLACEEMGDVFADGEFARDKIASIILSLGSKGTCLDSAQLKQSAIELYQARNAAPGRSHPSAKTKKAPSTGCWRLSWIAGCLGAIRIRRQRPLPCTDRPGREPG